VRILSLLLGLSVPTIAMAGETAWLTMPAVPADTVQLYDNLGTHHHAISTRAPLAQQYFDQGLRLVYAFNHAEAIRAFEEAARLDPDCGICWWGVAFAYGPNINAPMDSTAGVAAYAALQKALALRDRASEAERAYIDALAERYAPVPSVARAALDSAFATAMADVAARYPDDLDAATIAAEAAMDLRPWNYWTAEGEPFPGTLELVARLERVIERDPNHPGACHYYIHAVEAVAPEEAVPCAERLAGLMPGAGHIVHMPAHIYIRVGRYAEAVDANVHAVHTDETFIADQAPAGIYPGFYYPHNYHFLAFASTLAGRSATAIESARAASSKMPLPLAQAVPEAANLLAYPHLTLMTFGRWEDVLVEPLPSADVPLAAGQAHYARGVALAATRRFDDAEAELASVREAGSRVPEGWPRTVMEIADHALQGEIAARRGELEAAVVHLRAAARLEDGLAYTEPPYWHRPVRHRLGDVLMEAGRFREAMEVYREDLERFPENGWSLAGMAAALEAEGKPEVARDVRERLRAAWREADVQLRWSSF
jgi:tetratricopeptide (TPR) repeat protein